MGKGEEKNKRIDVSIASRFWDGMQYIIDVCLLKNEKDYDLVKDTFNELEGITQREECLSYISKAKSSFISFYTNKDEEKIDDITKNLSMAYDRLIELSATHSSIA